MDFTVHLRGYDRLQVDQMVERAEKASNSTDPVLRSKVRQELSGVQFSVVLRGYTRSEVDRFFEYMIDELA